MVGLAYLLKRLAFAALTIFVAASLNFALFRFAPGDAAEQFGRVPGASPALQTELRKQFGLDKPETTQFALYIKGLATGNLGVSYENRQSVFDRLKQQLGNTLPMVLAGAFIAIVIGGVLGVITAARRGSLIDHGGVAVSMMLYSLPTQWVGLMLVVLFGGLLPTGGMTNEFLIAPSFGEHVADVAQHMVLPSLSFALVFGVYVLIVRSAMIETLGEDYILTARAKGLSFWRVVHRHAIPNAMLPTITLIGMSLGTLVGSTILIEVVFSWPGIGNGMATAVRSRDYPMLEGQFLVLAVSVVLCNLVADLLYFRLDPRIKE